MRITRPGAAAILAGLAALAPRTLPAWQDRFDQWQAAALVQVLQIDRPEGLAPGGPLDDAGDPATGMTQDGLWCRKVEVKVSGPLGWDGFSAVLGSQTDLNSVSLSDAYAQWTPAAWTLRLGQERLPMGWEQQLGSGDLVGIQRALIFGFSNDGHLGPWGLGLMNERGWGLRGDTRWDWAGGRAGLQAGAFDTAGNNFQAAVIGVARLEARQAWGPLGLEVGATGLAGRASLKTAPERYVALGQPDVSQPWEAGDTVGGKGSLTLWAADAGADWRRLHARAELAWQTLDGWRGGGGHATAWLDLPGWPAPDAAPALYGRLEQAVTERPDGVHRPASLYRAATLGLSVPLAHRVSVKLEAQRLSDDDFPAFAGGQIYQAQLQWAP